jgi:Helix-turn-helix domain
MSSQLLTPDEVAECLRKKPKTLANWRSQGIGPAYLKVEGGVVYRWADVEKWLTSKVVHPSITARSA